MHKYIPTDEAYHTSIKRIILQILYAYNRKASYNTDVMYTRARDCGLLHRDTKLYPCAVRCGRTAGESSSARRCKTAGGSPVGQGTVPLLRMKKTQADRYRLASFSYVPAFEM